MVWSFTKLQKLTERLNEIEIEIDNLGIDTTQSDMLHIKRLTRERQRIDKLLIFADTIFSKDNKG